MIGNVADLIEFHEGRKSRPYLDGRGKTTIGCGRCLDTKPLKPFEIAKLGDGRDFNANPLTDTEIDFLRDNDIQDADRECIDIFGAALFASFMTPRQAALVDMVFEMGEGGLSKFRHVIAAIQAGDWATTASDALNSDWAKQVPSRARMDAEILRTGQWPSFVERVL